MSLRVRPEVNPDGQSVILDIRTTVAVPKSTSLMLSHPSDALTAFVALAIRPVIAEAMTPLDDHFWHVPIAVSANVQIGEGLLIGGLINIMEDPEKPGTALDAGIPILRESPADPNARKFRRGLFILITPSLPFRGDRHK